MPKVVLATFVRLVMAAWLVAGAWLVVGAMWFTAGESVAAEPNSVNIRLTPEPKRAEPMPTLPQPIALLAMIRSTILAVDHGNKTGNYTVVRDLGSSNFRDGNTAAKLAQVFAVLSAQGIDLLPVSIVDPEYLKPPIITPTRMIYVSGVFPIQPRKVAFEILYEISGGQWRVYGIAISPA